MPPLEEPISQGDILDECPVFGMDADQQDVDLESGPIEWKVRAVVMTQACDLAEDKTLRVVVAVVHSAQKLVDKGVLKAQQVRDKIRRHQVYGWYFLPHFDDANLPESLVDFRNLHSVPLQVLKQLVNLGNRRCRLETPYREHMSQHFANTYARIGLPEPYETQP